MGASVPDSALAPVQPPGGEPEKHASYDPDGTGAFIEELRAAYQNRENVFEDTTATVADKDRAARRVREFYVLPAKLGLYSYDSTTWEALAPDGRVANPRAGLGRPVRDLSRAEVFAVDGGQAFLTRMCWSDYDEFGCHSAVAYLREVAPRTWRIVRMDLLEDMTRTGFADPRGRVRGQPRE